MNARQIRGYAPWQLWDFLVDRGIAMLLVGGLMALSVLWPGYFAMRLQVSGQELVNKMLEIAVSQQVPILVVIAASGIVANDRIGGYFRFLFAKPVRMPSYYALQFLITLVGTLAVTLVLMIAFWVTIGWVSPMIPLVMIVATYLSLAGTVFFFSTFTRLDWAMLVVLWGASTLARTLAAGEKWYDVVKWVLPPAHHIGKLSSALFAGTEIDVGGATWLVGYGLVFFVAGLGVLQRKAIAE